MPENRFTNTGTNTGPVVFGGTVHGDLKGGDGHQGAAPEVTAELVALLSRLRAEVTVADVAKREVIEDNLDDLAKDAQDPDATPAVAKSRWEKVKSLLTGLSQFTELVAKISGHVTTLWPH
jgi:hypothetical protein